MMDRADLGVHLLGLGVMAMERAYDFQALRTLEDRVERLEDKMTELQKETVEGLAELRFHVKKCDRRGARIETWLSLIGAAMFAYVLEHLNVDWGHLLK